MTRTATGRVWRGASRDAMEGPAGIPPPGWGYAGPSLLARWAPVGAPPGAALRVAGFDLNDTLVVSRRGRPGYSVSLEDWEVFGPSVIPRLRLLHAEGVVLAVFSNQGNIRGALGGKRAEKVRAYVDAFLAEAAVPVHVFLATQKDGYRKPATGMWSVFRAALQGGGWEVDLGGSLFVGDALGGGAGERDEDAGFARALGLPSVHPRVFFSPPPPPLPLAAPPRLVLVLVGLQGSGKTTFAEGLAGGGGWTRVSQDCLGSRRRCEELAAATLREGGSPVIDRTNLRSRQRAPWLALAVAAGVPCHCLVFDHLSLPACAARVAARQGHEGGVEGARGVQICFRAAALRERIGDREGFARVVVFGAEAELPEELRLYGRGRGPGGAEVEENVPPPPQGDG